jgi:3-methyladenine DNA glycosylase/8-oxoguanine DNA glycosylase
VTAALPPAAGARIPAGGSSVRRLDCPEPIDLRRTLGVLRHGGGDPTMLRAPDGSVWRAVRTPIGPATVRILDSARESTVTAQAWGPGADWSLDTLPELLGARDNRASFDPGVDLLHRLHRTFDGWRLTYTGLVFESLVPAIFEQKVTGAEAFASYRRLIRLIGDPAPGPGADLGLVVPPEPKTWLGVPVWDFHLAGLGPERRDALLTAVRVAPLLERAGAAGPPELDAVLRGLRGIGVWTSAEVRQRALADADAVSIGDAHIPHMVGFALSGRRTDDEGMLRLLARWRGHRYRVSQLLVMGGVSAPRFGPRYTPIDHRGH